MKNDLGDIKRGLFPSRPKPSPTDPMDALSPSSQSLNQIRSKLVPGYNFFSISGSQNPEWTIVIPASNFSPALTDLTIVIGGDSWQTAANGRLMWLANFIRMLTQFAFAYIFLKMVITYLRQW